MAEASTGFTCGDPRQPVSKVARQALRQRLKAVWHFASRAAKKPRNNAEFVHQLRVATRRSRATIELFSDLLPKRATRRVQKQLRALRRAAGDVRDLDVLTKRLEGNDGRQHQALLKRMGKLRRPAQRELVQAYRHAKHDDFRKLARKVVKRARWRAESPEPTFCAAARERLLPVARRFFQASTADLSDPCALHHLRIQGKQVRYAIELLAGAFDASPREELFSVFKDLQDRLGAIHDHAVAAETFQRWRKRAVFRDQRSLLKQLAAEQRQQFNAERDAFLAWLTEERRDVLESRFHALVWSDSRDEPIALATPDSAEAAFRLP